ARDAVAAAAPAGARAGARSRGRSAAPAGEANPVGEGAGKAAAAAAEPRARAQAPARARPRDAATVAGARPSPRAARPGWSCPPFRPGAEPPRSRGRAPRADPHACLRAFAPLSTSFASSRYASAALPDGSYLSTDEPFTGASAYRTVFLIRVLNTRSPKFSCRISTASRECSVRPSYIVGRIPWIPTSGFRFSPIIDRWFSTW